MPELLVVVGIIALLLAIILTPLRSAHRQAKATRCAAQLGQIGISLQHTDTDYNYYPLWDDGGSPIRYTWIDVLMELNLLGNVKSGYCPEDQRPSELNSARGLHFNVLYPGKPGVYGVDYSYGIGVPLSAGGWNWQQGFNDPNDSHQRLFEDHKRYTSQRVLAGDAHWSWIYNLSGDAINGGDWSYPTQFDNTVAWRHPGNAANLLYQDGHVKRVAFQDKSTTPVNTALTCVWYPGESLHVGPEDSYNANFYPNIPPVILEGNSFNGYMPRDLIPVYYTKNLLWTQVPHKRLQ